jgi:type II secretory pathway component GspD/PulD (secretin)
MVSLTISLKDGAIDPTIAPLNGQAYTFTDREFRTQLKVTNHHTAVLAGVISEKHADTVHKVPFLNRLPYVGDKVFTNTARSSEKVELLTFITPYILNSKADVLMATEMASKRSRAPVLRKVDLVNGDWPEEFVDEEGNPSQTGPTQGFPYAPSPPR